MNAAEPNMGEALPEDPGERIVYLLRRAAERLRQSTPFEALANSCERAAWEVVVGAVSVTKPTEGR